ncbi:DUF421 domain-containing protein [Micrococcus cohnii]|uniref:Uncharacterized membrane protein YcaP (DUF421 family) n=1 Tax=Micrococcus cohnii TaxID=993416 RepID=A0A7W7GPT3_9MICC|nr:YetF domain-containing protein [Micrococcus cohnii]MBB4736044.1 uncharacterized membrane protein YcaP (DUF421 family) [Micrococcus cohnii]
MTPPQGWPAALAETLGIELWRIPVVVICAAAVYLTLVLLLRLFGARLLSGLSTFDTVVAITIGAVAGRVIIGHPPTLASGLIGILTLVLLEAAFGALVSTVRMRAVVAGSPRVLVAHGELQQRQMRRSHISYADLRAALRRAGLSSVTQAACVILEPSGHLSIIRTGAEIDPRMLHGVIGADRVLRGPAR